MANLNQTNEEELDKLPKQEKLGQSDDYYHGTDFPWKRAGAWFTSNVGRPIDDVFSDFVHLPWVPTQYRNHHQLTKFVEVKTFVKEGEVYFYEDRVWWGHQSHEQPIDKLASYRGDPLYVHPVTRVLCKAKKKKIVAKPKPLVFKNIGDFRQISKIDGLWFEVWADKVSEQTRKYFSPKDDLLKLHCNHHQMGLTWIQAGNSYMFQPRVLKRQLSSKELKKHGVKNDEPSVILEEAFKKRFDSK